MLAMFLNNLKIAYRNLIRNKAYSLINISGLAIGMACTILLLLWVNHELSYNKFHDEVDQIYKIANWQAFDGDKHAMPNLPGLLAETVKEKYPEIKYSTNFNDWGDRMLLEYNGKKKYIRMQHADPDFFKIFSFKFIHGNRETCLDDINSLVITERHAKKIFGDENPVGKTVKVDNRQLLTVTAVVENLPSNSTVHFNYLCTFELLKKENPWLNNWGAHNHHGFAKVVKGSDVEALNERLDKFYIDHVNKESKKAVFLFPIVDTHLYYLDGKPTRLTRVKMYIMIAIFILIIACFNFMNLSTARATKRAKEIGMKKAIGATYPQLIRQFLGESLLLTLISANFAILLSHLILPHFNNLMNRSLVIDYSSFEFWLIILGVTIFTGLIAGSYPAFYIASFNPISVLKGTFSSGKGSSNFRKTLVVLQFALASSLLIATLTIVLQTRFMSNMDIGMNTDNVIRVNVNKQMRKKMETIKTELKANSIIESITHTQQPPYKVYSNGWGLEWEGKDPNYSPLITYPKVDPGFLETFKIELKEGRFFNADNPAADSMCVVVNEKFAKIMSDQSVVNNTLRNGTYDYRIIGVVKDYNVTPNRNTIQPVLIRMTDAPYYMYVRYVPGNSSKAVNVIKDVCDKYNPDFPLKHSFMHNNYDSLFTYNRKTADLLLFAAILSIIVSCLGLFGLASFTAEERTKEIGVRKVLGASMQQLIMIFGKDFSKWIIISSLVSWPVTYYIMEEWFTDYPFRIDFPYWLFAAVLAILLIVAIITIGYQSWKSATRNPVVSLKYE